LAGKQLPGAICLLFVFLLSAVCCNGYTGFAPEPSQTPGTPEAYLTDTYGDEVSGVIETFEGKWLSLEAHVNPAMQSELATEPYLEIYGYARMGDAIYDEPFWLATTSAKALTVRVVEYTPERFKAVASVARTYDKTTTEGEIIAPSQSNGVCGVYVFVREDDTWKLSGLFLTGGPPDEVAREWGRAPRWLKDIIGDLPDGVLCYWFEDFY
jgi:hypothetical protein